MASAATNLDQTIKKPSVVKFGAPWPPKKSPQFNYTVLPEYFVQTETADPDIFDFRKEDLGLNIKTSDGHPDWKTFAQKIEQLNDEAEEGVCYKVLYLARHGEGPHNVAIKKYGMSDWDAKRARVNGDGDGLTWGPDPDLTEIGCQEARYANSAWKDQISKYGLLKSGALAQHYYCSPFTRAATTLYLTWNDIVLNLSNPPRPLVVEFARETIGWHTCDQRGKMSVLKNRYPMFDYEESLTEEDEIWTKDLRESYEARDDRLRGALDDLFLMDGATWISITAHSGCIQSMVRATGHRKFYLQTGGMIPLVVRAELLNKSQKLPPRVIGLPYGPFEEVEENAS